MRIATKLDETAFFATPGDVWLTTDRAMREAEHRRMAPACERAPGAASVRAMRLRPPHGRERTPSGGRRRAGGRRCARGAGGARRRPDGRHACAALPRGHRAATGRARVACPASRAAACPHGHAAPAPGLTASQPGLPAALSQRRPCHRERASHGPCRRRSASCHGCHGAHTIPPAWTMPFSRGGKRECRAHVAQRPGRTAPARGGTLHVLSA